MNTVNLTEKDLHVVEKFNAYAQPHNISFSEVPRCSTIVYKGKTSNHMATPAIRSMKSEGKKNKNVSGFLVNMGDKRIRFFQKEEIVVVPIKK